MNLHRRALLAALASAWWLASSIATAGAQVEKERSEVPEVAPITLAGVRYEAPPWGRMQGLPQNGGYVVATDTRTDRVLWRVRVYKSQPKVEMESDKQDVFITTLQLEPGHRALRIEDERGRHYRLDLRTRRVTRLADHAAGAASGP